MKFGKYVSALPNKTTEISSRAKAAPVLLAFSGHYFRRDYCDLPGVHLNATGVNDITHDGYVSHRKSAVSLSFIPSIIGNTCYNAYKMVDVFL